MGLRFRHIDWSMRSRTAGKRMGYDLAGRPESMRSVGPHRADREFSEYLFRHIIPYDRLYDKASYQLNQEGGKLTLITSLPMTLRGKNIKLEFTDDVTGRFSFDSVMQEYRQSRKAMLTDELTGLYNRRFINQALSGMLSQSKEPFTLMMADIDRFKAVNDTFGHVAGDRVLCRFAGLLLSRIRKGRDWVARYGGEEFLICLKETKRESVFRTADRIRRAVMRHGFPCGETVIRLTCSIGACRMNGAGDNRSVEEWIESVDENLYKAKKAGRNRIGME